MWYPTVNVDLCDSCDGTYKCVEFCPNAVLEIQDEKASVTAPLSCIDKCSSCALLCPRDAIMFPSKTVTEKTSKKPLLHKVVCRGCEKRFFTDRDIEYCFDCENR
ncbi:MAG: hypothetical protein V3V81_06510 [Candidatus Bathyarchaeia archaeon]